MLNFEQIKDLIELVADHGLSGLELERSGFRLKIDGGGVAPAGKAALGPPQPSSDTAPMTAAGEGTVANPAPAAVEVTSVEKPAAAPAEDELPANAHVMKSPIVGTFYRTPSPEAPPFVEVGDKVEQGQVLCIVEAMKLMNEIESDIAGRILGIYPQNSQPVEFGESLFVIQPG